MGSRIKTPRGDSNALFASSGSGREPLASRMRPRTLDEFIGQEHIVGPGRLLRRAIQRDQLSSLIFSGPPGTGKTTLARIIANTTMARFEALNAVLSGVAELRTAIETARQARDLHSLRTILFVDEVHRWNKSQQDALLPWVENGTIVLIGATTENPFFEVNRALVSRSRIFLLRTLTDDDLMKVAQFTLKDVERGYGNYDVRFAAKALEHLVRTADGDARSLLNALELAIETSVDRWPPPAGARIEVSLEAAEESIQRKVVLYDKDGDYHYDTISAFIKCLRGSDPDAALYWLARMVYAGEDPTFIFRRMLISAAEDVGLADPEAIGVVTSCAQAFDRIGMPEGQYHLTLAALYLATCPKSNSTLGYFDALKTVEEESAEVPDHLKDSNRDQVGFGHGEGYKYPHAYKDHWVAQRYLPETLKKTVFYHPSPIGEEGKRRTEVLERREAQLAVLKSDLQAPGVWSSEGSALREWTARAEGSATIRLRMARAALFDALGAKREDRIFIADPRRGYYALEALRRSPEGTIAVFTGDDDAAAQLERLVADTPDLLRPLIAGAIPKSQAWLSGAFGFSTFDVFLVCEFSSRWSADAMCRKALLDALAEAYARGTTTFAFFDILGDRSSRLSDLLRRNLQSAPASLAAEEADALLIGQLSEFEDSFGGGPGYLRPAGQVQGSRAASDEAESFLAEAGIKGRIETSLIEVPYERPLPKEDLDAWLRQGTTYGDALRARFPEGVEQRIYAILDRCSPVLSWPLVLSLKRVSPDAKKS